VLIRSPDRDGINDRDLEGTNEHVRSQECCERRRLAAATGLPGRRRCAAAARSGNQTFDKTLDAPVSTVFRVLPGPNGMTPRCQTIAYTRVPRSRKLCRASAGIQSFGLQRFVSDRVAVEVSVPLLVPLALFIVGCDSSCHAIRWLGSALARSRRGGVFVHISAIERAA
jgi:hypothetical protein